MHFYSRNMPKGLEMLGLSEPPYKRLLMDCGEGDSTQNPGIKKADLEG
jgi:hypothetical protein